MLKGYSKKGFKLDDQLPVTLPILEHLISTARNIASLHYETCLFHAMCTIPFFAFLRVSEMTINVKKSSDLPLQLHQVSKLCTSSHFAKATKIYFGDYKDIYKGPFPLLLISKWLGVVQFNAFLNILSRVIIAREHFSSFVMVKLSLGILFHFFSLQH